MRYQAIQRSQTWKNNNFNKKRRLEFTKYTATKLKHFNAFNVLLKSSVFHYEDRMFKGSITLEDDIFKFCPLSYPSTCSRTNLISCARSVYNRWTGKVAWNSGTE
uniref:Uncharacterized protein n=1 Tax=Amphimedon queenslandica TaxID=400682 RepID=A0A1X7VCA8_AMPQE